MSNRKAFGAFRTRWESIPATHDEEAIRQVARDLWGELSEILSRPPGEFEIDREYWLEKLPAAKEGEYLAFLATVEAPKRRERGCIWASMNLVHACPMPVAFPEDLQFEDLREKPNKKPKGHSSRWRPRPASAEILNIVAASEPMGWKLTNSWLDSIEAWWPSKKRKAAATRGRPANRERDRKWREEYEVGLKAGRWKSKAAYARYLSKTTGGEVSRSTLHHALKRKKRVARR